MISSSITGASRPGQVIENAAASELLSPDHITKIEEITELLPTNYYR